LPQSTGPIEHRAFKVSLVNGFTTILIVGFQMVSVPVCLHYWGKENYGSWLALNSAFLLLRSLDGGYQAYVGNKLNYLYHRSTAALHAHLSSAVFGIAIINALQLVLAAGTLIISPLSAMLGVPVDDAGGLTAGMGLVVLMVSWVFAGSYIGIVHRLLIPAGLMYQAAWWNMETQVCQFIAIMAAAMLRFDMLQTSVLFAISLLVSYLPAAIYVRRKLPVFTPWWKEPKASIGLKDLGQSLLLTSSNLIQQSATNGSVLLISALAGPAAVPVFTTVRTLTNLWTSLTTVLSTPFLPDVVRLHATGETRKLLAINEAYWVVVGTAVNFGALLSYPLIPFLYGQWTAHHVALDRPLLCLLLASVVIANTGALMALHLNGINSLRIGLAASVARAVLGLGGGALCFGHYGLAGFGLGILGGEIVATLMTARYFLKHEVVGNKGRIDASDIGPITLGTGSVLVFFLGAGFGWWGIGGGWFLAMIGVGAASVWGWRTMDKETQNRLGAMAAKIFGTLTNR
jgi:O-antigen/teichoic acid export membrane protein